MSSAALPAAKNVPPPARRVVEEGPPRGRRGAPTLVAVLGGLLLWLAFPATGLWPLAVLGPAALSAAVHGRSIRAGLWLGFVTGAGCMLPLLHWTGVYVGAWPWLLLATFEAAHLALLGGGLVLVQRLPLWPLWAACLWVADEALRGRLIFGGFPWGRLGQSQPEGWFTAFAGFGGIPLISAAVALSGALLAAAVLTLRDGRAGRYGVPVALAALLVPVAGALLPIAVTAPDGTPTATIALIQGDVPQPGLDFNAERRAVLDNHVRRTLELADAVRAGTQPRPDLVIWPENSSDIDPYRNADAAAQIERAVEAIGVPILVGAVRENDDDTLSNLGIVWAPGSGPGQTYAKRHPVPFGEYIPWRATLERLFPIVNEVPRDFVPGERPGTLDAGGLRVGDVICFEVAYDGLVGDVVDAGAQVIVVQTNNATFGYTDATYQQLAMGRIRAVEHGRTVLVVSTSGVSAVISADGTVRARSELFEPATFVAEVPLRTDRTVATRLGASPEWTMAVVGVAAMLAGGLLPQRHRNGRRPPSSAQGIRRTTSPGPLRPTRSATRS